MKRLGAGRPSDRGYKFGGPSIRSRPATGSVVDISQLFRFGRFRDTACWTPSGPVEPARNLVPKPRLAQKQH